MSGSQDVSDALRLPRRGPGSEAVRLVLPTSILASLLVGAVALDGPVPQVRRGIDAAHARALETSAEQLRHRLEEDLGEVERLARTGEGLAMLIVDIDDFKQLNDRYGHAAGDEFLRQPARILRESVRETDLVAPYGGEEFVILATGTDLSGGAVLAEKLRTTIAESSFIVDASMRPRRITVSIPVA